QGCGTLKRTRLGGYVGIETYGRSVRPILTFTHRYHLLAIGSESRQPVTLGYMARYMLSDLSFDDYLRAGGWRGYAHKAAKDAFVTEARSWLELVDQVPEGDGAVHVAAGGIAQYLPAHAAIGGCTKPRSPRTRASASAASASACVS